MNDVFTLLDKLENELLSAKNAVFSKKAMVDSAKCLQLLAEIKNGLPSSLKKAQDILDNSVEIVRQSTQKAKEIVEDAQKRADELVSQSEVLRRAESDAKTIRGEATQFSARVKNDSRMYVDDMLSEMERFLSDTIACVRNNREELRGSIIKDKKLGPQDR